MHEDPELPDVYTVQSRIAKHAGDLDAAAAAACKAESLDLADRWALVGGILFTWTCDCHPLYICCRS